MKIGHVAQATQTTPTIRHVRDLFEGFAMIAAAILVWISMPTAENPDG
jgi:hypothetical protein